MSSQPAVWSCVPGIQRRIEQRGIDNFQELPGIHAGLAYQREGFAQRFERGRDQPTQADVSWNASTDNVGVAGYYLFRDGVKVTTTALTYYVDTG